MAYYVGEEPLTTSLCETIDAYLDAQYMHTVASTDLPPYEHDWQAYMQLQSAGLLLTVVARTHREEVVGYAMYVITPMLHHRTEVVATCDSLVTFYPYRGKGVGSLLLECATDACTDRGVNRMVNHHRLCYDSRPLFPQYGFKLIEHVYMKEL